MKIVDDRSCSFCLVCLFLVTGVAPSGETFASLFFVSWGFSCITDEILLKEGYKRTIGFLSWGTVAYQRGCFLFCTRWISNKRKL